MKRGEIEGSQTSCTLRLKGCTSASAHLAHRFVWNQNAPLFCLHISASGRAMSISVVLFAARLSQFRAAWLKRGRASPRHEWSAGGWPRKTIKAWEFPVIHYRRWFISSPLRSSASRAPTWWCIGKKGLPHSDYPDDERLRCGGKFEWNNAPQSIVNALSLLKQVLNHRAELWAFYFIFDAFSTSQNVPKWIVKGFFRFIFVHYK